MTITSAQGAGTGAVVSFVGTDQCGSISITTGPSPQANYPVFVLQPSLLGSFNLGVGNSTGLVARVLALYPANANAINANSILEMQCGVTASLFAMFALSANTTYQWTYRVD